MGRLTRDNFPEGPDFAGSGSMRVGVGKSARIWGAAAVLRTKKVPRVPNIGFWLKNRGGAAGQSCRIPAFSAAGIELRHPGCRTSTSRCRISRNCCTRRVQKGHEAGGNHTDETDRHGRGPRSISCISGFCPCPSGLSLATLPRSETPSQYPNTHYSETLKPRNLETCVIRARTRVLTTER